MLGTIEEFDVDAGLGSLRSAEGDRFAFHCTAVSDGSRQIPVGSRVVFAIGPAGPGVWEATAVTLIG